MTYYTEVSSTTCGSENIKMIERSTHGEPRYRCFDDRCRTKTFLLEYRYKAYAVGVKEQSVEMAINGSGIRDTSRVLGISKSTVISTIKAKESCLIQVNPKLKALTLGKESKVRVELVCEEAEMDEQWSLVSRKSNQRGLWYAADHATNTVLAYIFGRRKDDVFKKLKALLAPFDIKRFYTDDWGAYDRIIDKSKHVVAKRNTQKIERKNPISVLGSNDGHVKQSVFKAGENAGYCYWSVDQQVGIWRGYPCQITGLGTTDILYKMVAGYTCCILNDFYESTYSFLI